MRETKDRPPVQRPDKPVSKPPDTKGTKPTAIPKMPPPKK